MAKKKKWSEWAHAWVRNTGKCPGDTPSFGLPEALVTEEEFNQSMEIAECHKWNNCHFGVGADEEDPITAIPKGMKKLFTKDSPNIADVKSMVPNLEEVMDAKRIMTLKRNLHSYVDRIILKDDGTLIIPNPLLEIKEYIGKFFEVV